MAADGSDSASFTVRLINQVTAPARQIQAATAQVEGAMRSLKKSMDLPTPKRSPLSDWDKMLSKAKLSQAKDFAAQHKKMLDEQNKASKEPGMLGKLWDQLGPAALSGGVAGAVAAGMTEVIGLAKSAVSAIVDVGAAFFHASLEAAAFADRSTLAIGYLTDRVDLAGGIFDSVRHSSQELGLNVEETMGSFQKLLAAQFTIGQSKALVKMGADMQAIGASGEEVQRILYAMTEIKSIGSLQKRQERMLQMAGISGKLIDEALMKAGGFKDQKGVDTARKKNKISADVAMQAIIEAVKHKTHEAQLGDVGRHFADSTLTGMQQQLAAGAENLFVDIGQRILPGVTQIAQLIKGTIGKLADDPQIHDFANRMLIEFQRFAGWTVENWPQIEAIVIGTTHAIADTITFVAQSLDAGTERGKNFRAVLEALEAPFRPIIALADLLCAEIDYLVGAFDRLMGAPAKLNAMVEAFKANPSSILPSLPAFMTPGNDNGIRGVTASNGIGSLLNNGITEAGHNVDARHEVNMNGMVIQVTSAEGSSPESIAQKIHSELAHLLRQAS